MKVLYHFRTSAQDGSAVHIDGLIGALRDLGVEVVVAAPSIAGSTVRFDGKSPWISKLRKRLPRVLHELAELAYNVPEALRLARMVRAQRPDLLYERSNLYLLSGAWVAQRFGIPFVTEINAPYFLERSQYGGIALPRIARWSERVAWRGADVAVAVTGALADLVAEVGVEREKLHVMPNGVDRSSFGTAQIDAESKSKQGLERYMVLGFTGYVREWNGLESVLELLAAENGSSLFLLLVGDGPARPHLEGRARELGVADRVRFTGKVARDRVPFYVSAFDIALQPAANPYASPLKLFEYMALGRAIVAPDQPNIREILGDGRDALLFAAGDSTAFAAAVSKLVADEHLRARIAAGAVETTVRRDLTWRRNAERVVELARHLIDSRQGAGTEGQQTDTRKRA